MEKILTEEGNLSDLQRRILKEEEDFDLDKFYHGKSKESAAIVIITDNQMIMTDVFAKNHGYGTHYNTAKEIYKAIYGEGLESEIWQKWYDEITNDGNILIQLLSYDPSLIYLPDTITPNMLEFLKKLNTEINKIKENDEDCLKKNPILFMTKEEYKREDLNEIVRRLENERVYRTGKSQKR